MRHLSVKDTAHDPNHRVRVGGGGENYTLVKHIKVNKIWIFRLPSYLTFATHMRLRERTPSKKQLSKNSVM